MDFKLNEAILILERVPQTLRTLLRGLPDDWVYTNEGADTWSPFDILGHLIHGENTDWIPRAKIILDEHRDKNFIPFDRFAQFENSKGKTLDELLEEFARRRAENIQLLKELHIDADALKKEGIHPEFGAVSLEQLLAAWVVHDLGHIHQITRVMAKNQKAAVGPWLKYLKVLHQ